MFLQFLSQLLFLILFLQQSFSLNSDCQIIENEKITKRLVFHPQSDFCIIIRSCLFTSISCDIFDNGGAISLDHELATLSISQSSFFDCKCYQKKGGAIYLNTKNSTLDKCCSIGCFSRYGLFLEGIVKESISVNMSTITNCNCGESFFTSSTINTAGGRQIISFINSSSNNLNIYNSAGLSVMPNELSMSFCNIENNIGESIISVNYLIEQTYNQRSIDFINVYNNTLKTACPFPQALMVFFVDNVTVTNAIFQKNSAEYSTDFYTLYESQNVHTIIKDSVFDHFSTKYPMVTINCSFNSTKDTFSIELFDVQQCEGFPPNPPDSNSSKKKIIIIVSSVVAGVALIVIIVVVIVVVRKKKGSVGDNRKDLLVPLYTND